MNDTPELPPLGPEFAAAFVQEKRPACQLYLISPPVCGSDFAARLEAALVATAAEKQIVAAFQLRVKDKTDDEIVALAEPLQAICSVYDVAFILNDNAALAARLKADGVHLGQSDGSVKAARALLGKDAQIGVTCHDSRHLAMEAGEAGADYVAFGAFYPTTTKDTTHRPDPGILGWWVTLFGTPCVAIGGITPENASCLVAAGADFIAVSSAVWGAEDVAAAVRSFGEVMKSA